MKACLSDINTEVCRKALFKVRVSLNKPACTYSVLNFLPLKGELEREYAAPTPHHPHNVTQEYDAPATASEC